MDRHVLAVDLGTPIDTGSSAQYLWLRLHGPDYGWDNPSWARLDGSKPEPWHFEFFAAGPVPNRALSESDVELWQAGAGAAPQEPSAPGDPSSPDATQPGPLPTVTAIVRTPQDVQRRLATAAYGTPVAPPTRGTVGRVCRISQQGVSWT